MAAGPEELGEQIRSLRHQARLSQEKLARAAGISRIALSMVELGRQRPSPAMLRRLAEAFHIEPEQLAGARPEVSNSVQRMTLALSPDFDVALKDLSKKQSISRNELVRLALQAYLENIGYESYFAHEDVGGQKLIRRIRVRSAKQVMFHSNLLISAFEEALDYDPQRHHNQPPPTLRLDDTEYLAELRKLVTELKQMNSFLTDLTASRRAKSGPPVQLRKHLDIFLKKYSATLGYGAGMMTLGLIATLLYQLGAGEAVFDHVLRKIPGR
jgi:transcriptional regulator with XRE-family HTH domain